MVLEDVEPKNIEATESNMAWTNGMIFDKLSQIDVKEHVELKNGFKYLSWSWAWTILNQTFDDVDYTVTKFPFYGSRNNLHEINYQISPGGAYVETTLTINGKQHTQSLPVMGFKNESIMKPNSMQVNKTILRCLVKTAALFGLGINLYAGEDLPVTPDYVTKDNLQAITQLIDIYAKLKNGSASKFALFLAAQYQVPKLEELTNDAGIHMIQYLTGKVKEITDQQEAK